MTFEEVTLKNVKVTINFEIDLDTLEHYFETKEKDGNDIEAIYDMICTHFARLDEQGEPDNMRSYFDIDPETFVLLEQRIKSNLKKSYVTDSDHPQRNPVQGAVLVEPRWQPEPRERGVPRLHHERRRSERCPLGDARGVHPTILDRGHDRLLLL